MTSRPMSTEPESATRVSSRSSTSRIPELSTQIGKRFAALQALLDDYRVGSDDFVFYDTVTEAQRKELSDAVNALSEPLSRLTGAITL